MMLEIKNAEFSYDKKTNVFEDINFSIQKSDVLCVLGPNGSGKTTLLKCLTNILELTKGQVLLDNKDIRSLNRKEISKKIAYLPQTHSALFPFPVLEVAVMGRGPHLKITESPTEEDYDIAKANLEMLGIAHLAERPYTKISGGQRQLALIAMVLTQEPEILLLDEPTSHLDFGNQVRLLELIEKFAGTKELAVVFTSHYPDHAFHLSCKAALMNNKQFINVGDCETALTEENLKEIYCVDVKVVYIESADSKVCVPLRNSKKKRE
jgi:iron complex transport system ATP-binding protein